MTSSIISIGDEILIGQITNTNALWMAPRLNDIGVDIRYMLTVGDDLDEILSSLNSAEKSTDLILITGGLGPTKDDKTKDAVCKYFDTILELNEDCLYDILALFKRSGKELTPTNRSQALIPKTCIPIRNRWGTAPGMWFKKKNSAGIVKHFIFLPGVPFEMKQMMEELILPELKKILMQNGNAEIIIHKTLVTSGIGESFLSDKLENFEKKLPYIIKLAYLPSPGFVKLRLSAKGKNKIEIEQEMKRQTKELEKIVKNYLVGSNEDKPENALGAILIKKKKTIACAESCTGGYLSHLLTSIPGSSAYFKGSVISYNNSIKIKILNVSEKTIIKHGAVSEEVALQMASGVLKRCNSDIGVAITGIAGPTGGTKDKPVGTVYIACVTGESKICRRMQFNQNRIRNIEMSAIAAMNLVRKEVGKIK